LMLQKPPLTGTRRTTMAISFGGVAEDCALLRS
jgi:hypothetical protein